MDNKVRKNITVASRLNWHLSNLEQSLVLIHHLYYLNKFLQCHTSSENCGMFARQLVIIVYSSSSRRKHVYLILGRYINSKSITSILTGSNLIMLVVKCSNVLRRTILLRYIFTKMLNRLTQTKVRTQNGIHINYFF